MGFWYRLLSALFDQSHPGTLREHRNCHQSVDTIQLSTAERGGIRILYQCNTKDTHWYASQGTFTLTASGFAVEAAVKHRVVAIAVFPHWRYTQSRQVACCKQVEEHVGVQIAMSKTKVARHEIGHTGGMTKPIESHTIRFGATARIIATKNIARAKESCLPVVVALVTLPRTRANVPAISIHRIHAIFLNRYCRIIGARCCD